jgi:hypothetical protein
VNSANLNYHGKSGKNKNGKGISALGRAQNLSERIKMFHLTTL